MKCEQVFFFTEMNRVCCAYEYACIACINTLETDDFLDTFLVGSPNFFFSYSIFDPTHCFLIRFEGPYKSFKYQI